MTAQQNEYRPAQGGRRIILAVIAVITGVLFLLSGCSGDNGGKPEDTAREEAAAQVDGGTDDHGAEEVCTHRWVDGVCSVCGEVCSHEWADGVCAVCGKECCHEWTDGVCTVCGKKCSHEHHDPQTRICTDCGIIVPHSYIRGVCALCGGVPEFCTTSLEDRYYEPVAENAGTIEELEYYTPKFGMTGRFHKAMSVYLPYNYDPSQKYNVFILCPGLSGRLKWLEKTYTEAGYTMNGKNVLDNMMLEGLMKPMIVVVIDTSVGSGKGRYDTTDAQIGLELREAILPALVERYSTYAEDGSYESLVAAREHFGIGGASNGSLYAYAAGGIRNLELFSNLVCMSGCTRADAMRRRLNADKDNEYPVYMFCSCAGDIDVTRKKTYNGFYTVIGDSDKFMEGENAFFVQSIGAHDWHVWYTGLYNFLPLLFPDRPSE